MTTAIEPFPGEAMVLPVGVEKEKSPTDVIEWSGAYNTHTRILMSITPSNLVKNG